MTKEFILKFKDTEVTEIGLSLDRMLESGYVLVRDAIVLQTLKEKFIDAALNENGQTVQDSKSE